MPYCKIETLTEQDLKASAEKSHGDSFKLGSQVKDFNPIKFGSRDQKETWLDEYQSKFHTICIREEWCNFTNTALEKSNRIERYTHKSYKDLGLQISATIHEGEMVKSRIARGKEMKVHDYNLKQKPGATNRTGLCRFHQSPHP